ncbi:MAG: hydroxymethylglutaryl-CoA synthase family protein [Promethearchaeota archaeon]
MERNDLFSSNIGIDSIGFYSPHLFLSLKELANARNIDPNKYKYGLMTNEMRIPNTFQGEDSISLGVKAGYNAILRGKINPKEIDAVFVGSESYPYAVKSISNIYKDLLGVSKNCFTQDISNACAAASMAILNAIAMIEAGIINKALVIAVDISIYDLYSSGEPTQGAGAVALILSRNPRIAVFSNSFGKVSANINDFFRPAGEKTAQVFSHYSVDAYLNLQLEAYDDLISKTGEISTHYYLFHAPYAKLPLKIIQKLIAERWIDKIEDLIRQPQKEKINFKEIPYFNDLSKNFLLSKEIKEKLELKHFSDEKREEIEDWIIKKIKNTSLPPLQVPALFGNMYSAAIWAEFLYLVENFAQVNDTIYFGSYGSGSTCISGLLKIQPNFKSVLNNSLNMREYLNNKIQISVPEYEKLHENKISSKLQWGKIVTTDKHCAFTLNYCDEGCNLSQYSGINYCPKGHSGNNSVEFPLTGTLTEIKPYNNDITPLLEGYVLITDSPKIGSTMEFELRRWKSPKKNPPNSPKGLLNWMPIYRSVSASPYFGLVDDTLASKVDETASISETNL